MEQYKASNGYRVELNDEGDLTIKNADGENTLTRYGHLDDYDQLALREFFRAEEDERLGRWRWPENPDYVVYPDGTSRRVVREPDGQSMSVSLHDRKVMTTYLDSYVGAARAFDSAHPEPKPWHDAKPGEVWVLRIATGSTFDHAPAVVSSSANGGAIFTAATYDAAGTEEITLNDPQITYATRIWPEES